LAVKLGVGLGGEGDEGLEVGDLVRA